MARTSVGILRGGSSGEYNLSLKTGAAMLAALPEDRYETRDIFIDKQGMWHLRGVPVEPARALAQVDVVVSALHGGAGEDGTVQRIIERLGLPYAGSRALAAALSLNKVSAHDVLEQAGVRMPRGVAFSLDNRLTTGEMARFVFEHFGPPYVVKPVSEGAAAGIVVASTLPALPDALGDVLDAYGAAIVEEFVRGREASVGVIEGFRGQELYVLPPARVVLPEGMGFMAPRAHEEGTLVHIVPSNFSREDKEAIEQMARAAHRALGMSHFSRADIILTVNGPVLLEVNAIPGLYQGASFPAMLESVGSSVREFLEHAIHLARG
jgi:D-alanine-D-alanine ligase